MAGARHFGLLLWKNYVLQKRHPLGTAFQLIIPVLLSMMMVIIRQKAHTITHHGVTDFRHFNLMRCKLGPIPQPDAAKPKYGSAMMVSYAPQNEIVDRIMVASTKLYMQRVGMQPFATEDDLVQFFSSNMSTSVDVAGVVFVNVTSVDDLAGSITYKLRLPIRPQTNFFQPPDSFLTAFTYPASQSPGPRDSSDYTGGPPGYCSKGFLTIQHAVAMGIAQILNQDTNLDDFALTLQRFPAPPYYDDVLLTAIKQFLSLILMLSLLYPAFDLVKGLVLEKERKLKESMKMMGLSGFLHWTSWFTKSLILFGIDGIFITILMCCSFGKVSVLIKSDGSLVFVFILLYIISGISFCFMISTFFSKANSAATAAGLLWFASYFPYFYFMTEYNTMTFAQKALSSLLCNVAMAYGGLQIGKSEGAGFGMQWYLLTTPSTPDDNFTLGWVMIMLIVDTFLYLLITWYLDSVFPGEYGTPEKWYFPFQKKYWCRRARDKISNVLPPTQQQIHPEFFEVEPTGINAGVQIQGLMKVFGSKVAVNNLNLNMFEGQITVLLGHNGAGKTTTMSMLTGLFPPSQGTAFVNGYDIRSDIENVRNSLGLCPQHNVVFHDLTVEEHLYFACKLRGCESSKIKQEIDNMLEATKLVDKRKALSCELSGGMQRRLCVGMALVGGSKVVMLDEPTSGMDPTARRFTWDLLQSQRKGRTILLSTHFMDEADILGDRIAIMASGQLQCCGAPMFLKKKYGAGYHMIIVKKPDCVVQNINTLVTSIIPKAELESNVGAELSFILPHNSSSKFPRLFSQIEERKEQLKIASYGASVTTMEEVFLRVGESSNESLKKILKGDGAGVNGYQHIEENGNAAVAPTDSAAPSVLVKMGAGTFNITRNRGFALYMQQIKAMLIKRMLHTKRNWLLIVAQLVAPIAIVVLALVILNLDETVPSQPPLLLNLKPFGGSTVLYSSNGTKANGLADLFASQFSGQDNPVNVTPSNPMADLNEELIRVAEDDNYNYKMHYVVGSSFYDTDEHTVANVMFNGDAYHSPAIALSALDSSLIQWFTDRKDIHLNVINDPLPPTFRAQAEEILSGFMTSFQISMNLLFGISFLVSSFVIFLVKERASDAKHLQFVSGVEAFNFWFATLLWDFVNYIFPCLCIMAVFAAFQQEGLSTATGQGCLFLIFFVYGWCVLPFMYILSFMFTVASSAYARVTMFNIFSGVVTLVTVTILYMVNERLREVAKILDWVFMLLPNYCLAASVKDLYLNYFNYYICHKYSELSMMCNCAEPYCLNYSKNYLAWRAPGIGRELVFMLGWGVVFFFLILLMELGLGQRLLSALFSLRWSGLKLESSAVVNPLMKSSLSDEDSDVAAERQRITNTPMENLNITDSLVMKNLTKYYGVFRPFLAVNHLCTGIPRGECFGLLGINGAGKTTTFKMLTGDETISDGDACIEGFSIRKQIKQVQQRLGYCPQFDAVIDEMTGRESLYMFSRLRGIPEKDIPDLVITLSKNLFFEEHVDKLVKDYSGGNKRKLSTAIALIGSPPIVFLDEPTTGMDPLARRMVWDAISRVRDSGSSIVLTSHSMEECDILCTRLAIMVNGRFMCLGSPQHLKNKFGNGYTLTAKVLQNSLTETMIDDIIHRLQAFIKKTFPGSALKDQHHGMVHYHIPCSKLSWADIFAILERAKLEFHLEDYAIGQTTLEQVFLGFTRTQTAGMNDS